MLKFWVELGIVTGAAVLAFLIMAYMPRAEGAEPCRICPNIQCLSSMVCGPGCHCLRVGAELGQCVSIN